MRLLLVLLTCTAMHAIAADDMVSVPAGTFIMGRDDGPEDECPTHAVTLPAFQIDRQHVTHAQFADFLNARGHSLPGGQRLYHYDDNDARIHQIVGKYVADTGFENHPVVEPSWLAHATSAHGAASACQQKQNGEKLRAVAMRGALLIHGTKTGPMLMANNPEIF